MPAGRFWRTNRGIGVALSVLFGALVVYLLSADWVYIRLRDGFYLGGFTLAGAVVMLVLSLALIFDRHRHDSPEEIAGLRAVDWLKAVLLLVGAWLMFELARRVSTLIAGPVFLFTLMLILGVRPWTHAALAAVLMGGLVYAVFRMLGVTMPEGALSF